jgi:hypothetical protein
MFAHETYDNDQTLRVMAVDENAQSGEWLESDTWYTIQQ